MKYIYLFFMLISNLYGGSLFYETIEKIFVSEDFINYKELNDKEYYNKKIKQFSIKIELNKEKLKTKDYYIIIVSDTDSLIYTNVKYIRQNHNMLIKLDKNSDELYFNYVYDKAKVGEFRCDIISQFEHDYLLHYEGILYGITYGIIFCAFFYYFIIYFSTKIKAFIYYSFMQLFVLFSLIGFVYCSFISYPNQEFKYAQAIIDFFETSGFLLTLLFVKEILRTKIIMPRMNVLINVFIILNIIDIFGIVIYKYSILYEYMPFFIGFLIPSIAGIIAILKEDKYASIYTSGWIFLCGVVYLLENYYFSISGIYIIHIAASFESLIFSFALGWMLRNFLKEQNEKEKYLIHKSKLASMGEMINNISHQWRQPLTHLSFINMNLELASNDNIFDKKYLQEKIVESNEQIDFMSKTIDSFRDFYKPQKEKEYFWISYSVQKVIDIMEPLLKIYNIQINFKIIKDKQIKANENEYSQVVLNLISNAKDELILRKIVNPQISIEIDSKYNKTITSVYDNANGVNEEIIDKIFEPYFTTKENGSGIGLYMSKTIINSHFKGELKVKNQEKGACFSIEV